MNEIESVQVLAEATARYRASAPEVERRASTFKGIRPGDRVTFLVPNGIGRNGQEWTEKSGRATLVFADHVVCNCGGRFGTPGRCDERNYVKHRTPAERKPRSFRQADRVDGYNRDDIGASPDY
jgi:hypothetical protein